MNTRDQAMPEPCLLSTSVVSKKALMHGKVQTLTRNRPPCQANKAETKHPKTTPSFLTFSRPLDDCSGS